MHIASHCIYDNFVIDVIISAEKGYPISCVHLYVCNDDDSALGFIRRNVNIGNAKTKNCPS